MAFPMRQNLIQEKSFSLGVVAEDLPLDSEIDIEYCNLGLNLFRTYKEISYQNQAIKFVSFKNNSFLGREDSYKDFRHTVALLDKKKI